MTGKPFARHKEFRIRKSMHPFVLVRDVALCRHPRAWVLVRDWRRVTCRMCLLRRKAR